MVFISMQYVSYAKNLDVIHFTKIILMSMHIFFFMLQCFLVIFLQFSLEFYIYGSVQCEKFWFS